MDAQPVDSELDTSLALHVMEWKRVAAAVAQTHEPATLFYVRKSRGVQVGRHSRGNVYLHTYCPWSPSANLPHAFEVLDALDKLGWWRTKLALPA